VHLAGQSRKNLPFAESPKGGNRAGVINSLIATCKPQGIEPIEYLRDVLARLRAHPGERIAELTARAWKAPRATSRAPVL